MFGNIKSKLQSEISSFNPQSPYAIAKQTSYNLVKLYREAYNLNCVTGILFKTKVGEKTIQVEEFQILSKSIRPIPIPKTDSDGNIYDEFKILLKSKINNI